MKTTLSLIALLSLSMVACDDQPGKGKPVAEVAEPVKVAPPNPAPAPSAAASAASASAPAAGTHSFSQTDSKIDWVGAKVSMKHEGKFQTFSGSINLPGDDVTQGSVTVEIDAASLTTTPEKLVGHLKSADFFDVEKFPKTKFVSTSIKAGGEKGATHTVTGNLDLHGVTKSITFPATIKVSPAGVDVDAEFVLMRKDWGIVYPGMPDDLIKDEVLIDLQIRAKKS